MRAHLHLPHHGFLPEFSHPPKVLVVDDDRLTREIMLATLGAECHTLTAESAEQAMDIATDEAVDLLLLDYELDGTTALELLPRLQRLPLQRHTPAIVITSHSRPDLETACLAAGAQDFVPKPFSGQVLRARARNQLIMRLQQEQIRQFHAIKLNQAEANLQQTTRQLEQSEQNFQLLVRHMAHVFWVIDAHFERVHYASPAYETLWMRPVSELLHNGKSWLEALPTSDLAEMERYLAQATQSMPTVLAPPDFRVIRPDGSQRWVRVRGYPIKEADGRIHRVAGIAEDVTVAHDLQARMASMQNRYKHSLYQRLEDERRKISLQLHDEVGQLLTALKINLSLTRRTPLTPKAEAAVDTATLLTDDTLASLRNLVLGLRPPQLDDLGLVAALRWHIRRVANMTTMRMSLDENLGTVRLNPDLELAVFRIVQEALTNALRHASAQTVSLQLHLTTNQLELDIQDDGIGFNPIARALESDGSSLGLRGMQERAQAFGGTLTLHSHPGGGCQVHGEWLLAHTPPETTS